MFARLDLIGRLTGIFVLLLLAVLGVNLAIQVLSRETASGEASDRFPLPDQAVAIVELLEAHAPAEWDQVLRAVRTPEFRVQIVPEVPGQILRHSRVPSLEWLVTRYLDVLGDRDVLAVRMTRPGEGAVANFLARVLPGGQTTVNLAIQMRDENFALFEVRSASPQRLFGIPVGLWLGVFGSLFFALALWAITREARPLRSMTHALDQFSEDGVPRLSTASGAPEIRRLIQTTNQMQHRISHLIRGRSILLGAISHDLRTFLTRLRMRVETLPEERQRSKAVDDIEQMTMLLDDAISISRGAFRERQYSSVDLAELTRQEIERRAPAIIELIVSDSGSGCRVSGDEVALTRLLANLLDNAQRYGSVVQLRLERDGSNIVLSVCDDGPGIPEHERKEIFEPFYRIDKARNTATGGSGLGLAIVRQIADAHNGTISVSSSKLGGAKFRVSLPKYTKA